MTNIDAALTACRQATDQMITSAEQAGSSWAVSPRPGAWSPSQIVEHVARSLEESARMAAGESSKFPSIPRILHPVVRTMLFKRVLRNAAFAKAKTNKAMNPASGPITIAAGRARLDEAHTKFDSACRRVARDGSRLRTTIFGVVDVADYVRSMELHTRHHDRQIGTSR